MTKETESRDQRDEAPTEKDAGTAMLVQIERFIHQFSLDADDPLNIEAILDRFVNQFQETFSFYHVQVYLSHQVDLPPTRAKSPPEPTLILAAGSGSAGKRRLALGFSLPLSGRRSLVAQAGREQTMVVAEDTGQADQYLPHALLPKTQAEIAIPLVENGRLLGVLDIQQDHPQEFSVSIRAGLRIIVHTLIRFIQQAEQARHMNRWQTQLDSLRTLLQEAVQQADRDVLIEKTTAFLGRALAADNYGFRFVDPQSGNLRNHPSYRHTFGQRIPTIFGPGEGISGRVFATGQGRLVTNVTEEPIYSGDPRIRSVICVPVWREEQVMGVIYAESRRPYAFRGADEELLTAVASQVATMLDKIALEQRMEQVKRERDALLHTLQAPTRQRSHALPKIADQARAALNGDICRIHLLTPDGETLQCEICLGDTDEDAQKQKQLYLGQGVVGRVALSGVPEVVANSRFDRRALHLLPESRPPVTALAAPMTLRQQVQGVLSVLRLDTGAPFTEADLPLLTALAEQAALTVENERLFQAERRKQVQFELIDKIGTVGALAMDEDQLLAQFTALVADHLHLSNFGVLLLEGNRSQLAPHPSYRGAQTTIPLATSLAGRVITTGTALYSPNVTLNGPFYRINPDTHSLFCLPLRSKDAIIGIINAESPQKNAFDEETRQLLRICGQHLQVALDRVRFQTAVRRQIPQQQILTRHIVDILAASSVHQLSQTIHETICDIFEVERSAVYLYAADQEEFVPVYTRGVSEKYIRALNDQFPDTPAYRLIHSQQPIIIDDIYQNPDISHLTHLLETEEIHSYALFPLEAPRDTPGALGVYRDQKRPFTLAERATGETIAHVVGVALQQMQTLTEKRHAVYRQRRRLELWEQTQEADDLPTLLSTLIHRSVNLVGADAGLLGLRLGEQMLSFYPHNVPAGVSLSPAQQREGLLGKVMEGEETVSLNNYGRSPQAEESWKAAGVSAFLGTPLRYDGESLGVLAFFHLAGHKQFTLQDSQTATALARQASLTIQNLRRRQALQGRIGEFSQALQRQETIDRQKDAFIHGMSHELRTPLGIILGHAELLENEVLGSLSSAQKESVKIITRRTRMINKMVDDLSVLLAAQTQEFQREVLAPGQLLEGMLADFRLKAEEMEIDLTADIAPDLPAIKGDPTHLRRVFDNLMSNALKFTPSGGAVSLQAKATNKEVVFAVRDTGVGMPSDQLERIFERFYQVRSGENHPGGTGLGLALVREIVEAHRGRVDVESEVGKGSRFEVRLPAHRA